MQSSYGRTKQHEQSIDWMSVSLCLVPGFQVSDIWATPPSDFLSEHFYQSKIVLDIRYATMAKGFLLGPLSASCAEQTFYRKKHFCCPSGHLSPNGRKGGTGGQQNKWNFQFFVFGKFHSLVIFYSIHLQPLSWYIVLFLELFAKTTEGNQEDSKKWHLEYNEVYSVLINLAI